MELKRSKTISYSFKSYAVSIVLLKPYISDEYISHKIEF